LGRPTSEEKETVKTGLQEDIMDIRKVAGDKLRTFLIKYEKHIAKAYEAKEDLGDLRLVFLDVIGRWPEYKEKK